MLSGNNLAGGKPVGDGGSKIRELHPSGKVARGKAIYEDKNGRLYQWDSLHGEWEVYNKRGRHLLVEDKDGNRVKGAVKGRRINV